MATNTSRRQPRRETRESVIRYEKSMRDLERAGSYDEYLVANERVHETEQDVSFCRRHRI